MAAAAADQCLSRSADLKVALKSRFLAVASRLDASPSALRTWSEELVKRYTELQRHYHTLEHVGAMIDLLDECGDSVHDKTAVALSIFFHDWVYDPQRNDNETESVRIFAEFAQAVNLTAPLTERVMHFIERTITHTLPDVGHAEDGDLALFLDFDLEVLSRQTDDYDRYARQIRREYSHVADNEYRKARAQVLKGFLKRERLYFSDRFFESREGAARRNLEWEISSLGSTAPAET